jgi:predicted DCC family thiol-disulfide oxidoreductase YuxK
MKPWKDWCRFWFRPQTAQVLGLYRIVLGLLTIYSFGLFAKDAVTFFSDAGMLTTQTLSKSMGRPYFTILQWIGSPLGVSLALVALFFAAACFTVGWHTRISSIVLFLLVTSFHERNNLVLNGGDTVLRTMLFYFMFAPAGAALSVDRIRQRLRQPDGATVGPVLIVPWAQRMLQVQVAVIYLVTAYAKSRGSLYHEGTAMYYVFGLVDFNIRGVELLMNYPVLCSFLTYSALLIELTLPFLLWFRSARPYAVLLGLFAHGWIIVFMTIPVFGVLMLATYIPFFTELEFRRAAVRIRRWARSRGARVYFDEDCPTCRRARRLVAALDATGRLTSLDARTADLPPGLDRPSLLEEMVVVTWRGDVYRGFDAWRWLLARMPALCVLAPLAWLPGVSFVGRRIYRRLARGRTLLSRCEGAEVCETVPRA